MKLIKKILSLEITYALIFFYVYMYVFAGSVTANAFGISYFLVLILTLLHKTFEEHSFLYALLYPIIFFYGFYNYGMHELAGVLLGTSVAGYLVINYKLVKTEEAENSKNLSLSSFILKNILTIQVLYSFYFYFNQIISDSRGQNKLDDWKVVLYVSSLLLLVWIIQALFLKFKSKLDFISYSNLIVISVIIISATLLYFPFLEVGSLNIILPFITGFIGILLVAIFSYLNSNKEFKFRRTITTLAYTLAPLILIIYYPWSISKHVGILFSTLGALSLNTAYFEVGKKIQDLRTRLLNLRTFSTNLFLFLGALFTLSAGGLITKLNIADIDYLIMLIAGIFTVYLVQDLRETLRLRLVKKGLVGVFSVLTIAGCALFLFFILDTGKLESLGSFLFGVISYTYIKNNFNLRTFTKDIKQSEVSHTYLENSLLNLLTALSVALILIKI